MRSLALSLGAFLYTAISQVRAQTSTDCNPLQKSCPSNPGLGTSVFTDFTAGKSDYWSTLEGTTTTYDPKLGAQFSIKASTDAPTMVMSKYIMFGRVELVAKSSPGTGIVSSFVLLSQDLDEIDWEWLGGDNFNIQTNFFGKGDTSSYDRALTVPVQTPIDTFHTYTIDWTAERMIWQINGNTVRTVAFNDPLTKGGSIYPQTPMQVKIGNWIGCLDASNPTTSGTCQWAGGQADLSKAPYIMSVKSINVTDYGCGGDYSYSDNSGSYQSIKSTGKCDGKGTGPGTKIDKEPEPAPGSGPGFAPGTAPGKGPESIEPIAPAPEPVPVAAPAPVVPPPPPKPVSSEAPLTKGTGAPGSSDLKGDNSTTSPEKTANPSDNTNPTSKNDGTAKSNTTNPISNTSDANGKPKHKYGTVEILVGILGLGLGYLIM